jgi:ketosteroid isomerase-like protein
MNRTLTTAVVACLAIGSHNMSAQREGDRSAAQAAMMRADRDFNQAMAEGNLARFLSFVHEDASFESSSARGRDAVAKAWAPFFEPGGPRIAWAPKRAESLVGGDVGYTIGTWERRTPGPDGRPAVSRGEYLTVWRRQKDGSWQAVFDTGSTQAKLGN